MPFNTYVAFPTANPAAADKVLAEWKERGYRTMVYLDELTEIINADVCLPFADIGKGGGAANEYLKRVDGNESSLPITRVVYPGFAKAANRLCRGAVDRGADIVVIAGDDIHRGPNLTASDIAAKFIERFPDTFGIFQPMGDRYGGCAADPMYCHTGGITR